MTVEEEVENLATMIATAEAVLNTTGHMLQDDEERRWQDRLYCWTTTHNSLKYN